MIYQKYEPISEFHNISVDPPKRASKTIKYRAINRSQLPTIRTIDKNAPYDAIVTNKVDINMISL